MLKGSYPTGNNNIQLPPILTHGWKLMGERLEVDWESETNASAIRDRVSFLRKVAGVSTQNVSTSVPASKTKECMDLVALVLGATTTV